MKRQGLLAMNSLIVLACLVGLWQAVVSFNHVPVYILPGPMVVAHALSERYPSLLNSLLITTEEAAGGLAASIVIGVAVAMLFAQWRPLRQLFYPYTILLDGADCGAGPASYLVGGSGDPFGDHRNIHHLSCADYRQHNAGVDQCGCEFD